MESDGCFEILNFGPIGHFLTENWKFKGATEFSGFKRVKNIVLRATTWFWIFACHTLYMKPWYGITFGFWVMGNQVMTSSRRAVWVAVPSVLSRLSYSSSNPWLIKPWFKITQWWKFMNNHLKLCKIHKITKVTNFTNFTTSLIRGKLGNFGMKIGLGLVYFDFVSRPRYGY